jgi:hypothetical protein
MLRESSESITLPQTPRLPNTLLFVLARLVHLARSFFAQRGASD